MAQGPASTTAFIAAGVGFVVDVIVTVIVSLLTEPKPDAELRGLVYSLTPKDHFVDAAAVALPWYRRPVPLAVISGVLVVVLNTVFH